jgi:TRAP-type mannitol/chloroaromatic compound transport system permease small subunit
MTAADTSLQPLPATTGTQGLRAFAWITIGLTFAYVIENYLAFWQGFPGLSTLLTGELSGLVLVQLALYVLAVIIPVVLVMKSRDRALRTDAAVMTGIANFIIRAAFWIVFLVGGADAVISFMRVEEMLEGFFGAETANAWNFNANRAPDIHLPLAGLAVLIAAFTKSLGFHWLALLVVLAELSIVLSRFTFSYEQAFMGDLVRFWYGALFLFASAHTLFDDGHVRVDVFYSQFRDRTKGKVNAWGAVLMGIIFCWVVLIMGMQTKSSLINAPLISLEVTQSGFGMYVKYMMAGFLGVFAVSMMVQFCAQLLDGVADQRGDPGSRLHDKDDELPGH